MSVCFAALVVDGQEGSPWNFGIAICDLRLNAKSKEGFFDD
jgi:hypothetical protein